MISIKPCLMYNKQKWFKLLSLIPKNKVSLENTSPSLIEWAFQMLCSLKKILKTWLKTYIDQMRYIVKSSMALLIKFMQSGKNICVLLFLFLISFWVFVISWNLMYLTILRYIKWKQFWRISSCQNQKMFMM